jgi:hypothetical protein
LRAIARILAKGNQRPGTRSNNYRASGFVRALILRDSSRILVRPAGSANVGEFPYQDNKRTRGNAADTSGGAASGLACDFLLSGYLVAVLLRFDSGSQRPLWADAEFFGAAEALKLGGHKVSISGRFDSGPNFIHGIVSR